MILDLIKFDYLMNDVRPNGSYKPLDEVILSYVLIILQEELWGLWWKTF